MSALQNLSRKVNWFNGFAVQSIPTHSIFELQLSMETARLIHEHNLLVVKIRERVRNDYLLNKKRMKR